MEEEQKALYGDVFMHAERDFFKHRLQSMFPKISSEGIETSLVFLEKQKPANCPCSIHTGHRGFDRIIFRRQPNRLPTNYKEDEEEEEETDGEEDDYFNVVAVDNNETNEDTENNWEAEQGVTGAASSTSQEIPYVLDDSSTSETVDTSTLHSMDQDHICTQMNKDEEEPMDSDETDDDQNILCGVLSMRSKYVCFKPLLYYCREFDRTYYYKYFKPYTFDHRLLTMGYDCKCPRRKIDKSSCSWYDTDNIYILETRVDLSIREKSAQQQIYNLYLNTINNLPDGCGCGTSASIAYMGHSTGRVELLHLHGRESHEVLLAILKKKKNRTFGDDSVTKPKRTKFDQPEYIGSHNGNTADIPCTKDTSSELSQSSANALAIASWYCHI